MRIASGVYLFGVIRVSENKRDETLRCCFQSAFLMKSERWSRSSLQTGRRQVLATGWGDFLLDRFFSSSCRCMCHPPRLGPNWNWCNWPSNNSSKSERSSSSHAVSCQDTDWLFLSSFACVHFFLFFSFFIFSSRKRSPLSRRRRQSLWNDVSIPLTFTDQCDMAQPSQAKHSPTLQWWRLFFSFLRECTKPIIESPPPFSFSAAAAAATGS